MSTATKTAVSEQPLSQTSGETPNPNEPTDAEIDDIFELGLVADTLKNSVNTVLESATQLRDELGIFNHSLKLSTDQGSVVIFLS